MQICLKLIGILKEVHDCHWYHTDIRPSNVIVIDSTTDVALIDWSHAVEDNDTFTKSYGAPAFFTSTRILGYKSVKLC